jgi:hypothetical protein
MLPSRFPHNDSNNNQRMSSLSVEVSSFEEKGEKEALKHRRALNEKHITTLSLSNNPSHLKTNIPLPTSPITTKLIKPPPSPIRPLTKLKLNSRLRAQLIEAMKSEEFTERDIELFQSLNVPDSTNHNNDENDESEQEEHSPLNTFGASQECWEDKVQRIRNSSPFGHLSRWSILPLSLSSPLLSSLYSLSILSLSSLSIIEE